MANAIVVLNAGSSSVKFSVFLMQGSELELNLHGQIEEINARLADDAGDQAARGRAAE